MTVREATFVSMSKRESFAAMQSLVLTRKFSACVHVRSSLKLPKKATRQEKRSLAKKQHVNVKRQQRLGLLMTKVEVQRGSELFVGEIFSNNSSARREISCSWTFFSTHLIIFNSYRHPDTHRREHPPTPTSCIYKNQIRESCNTRSGINSAKFFNSVSSDTKSATDMCLFIIHRCFIYSWRLELCQNAKNNFTLRWKALENIWFTASLCYRNCCWGNFDAESFLYVRRRKDFR